MTTDVTSIPTATVRPNADWKSIGQPTEKQTDQQAYSEPNSDQHQRRDDRSVRTDDAIKWAGHDSDDTTNNPSWIGILIRRCGVVGARGRPARLAATDRVLRKELRQPVASPRA